MFVIRIGGRLGIILACIRLCGDTMLKGLIVPSHVTLVSEYFVGFSMGWEWFNEALKRLEAPWELAIVPLPFNISKHIIDLLPHVAVAIGMYIATTSRPPLLL